MPGEKSTTEALRKALEVFRGPASTPVPTDPYEYQRWEMAGAHALFVHALLSIYEQATTIPPGKEVDFVGYALVWAATLEHHHEWEETRYFEMFSHKYDLRSSIVTEHAAFHGGLVALQEYLVSCLPAGSPYGFGDRIAPQ
ncbi:hypothetical protein NM688_g1425 [Phlebia brevispora]|uniref:Uncharacterized protein n=1 Tax=Phlebia brevispora TaxID=194682 RepID=A0ACC1TB81_9APHY|nr:hypothetical protein NM688_g1425 [Phlebia brevispora]